MLSLKHIEIDPAGFGFDPQTGETFTLNPVGALAFGLLEAGKSLREVAQAVTAQFDVRLDEAERDMADFVSRLTTLGLAQVRA